MLLSSSNRGFCYWPGVRYTGAERWAGQGSTYSGKSRILSGRALSPNGPLGTGSGYSACFTLRTDVIPILRELNPPLTGRNECREEVGAAAFGGGIRQLNPAAESGRLVPGVDLERLAPKLGMHHHGDFPRAAKVASWPQWSGRTRATSRRTVSICLGKKHRKILPARQNGWRE